MSQRIETFGALEAVIQNGDGYVAESLARKFVASRPEDKRGWRALIACIEGNGSGDEAVRMAEAFLAAFPDAPDVLSFTALLLCNHGRYGRADALLSRPGAALDGLGTLTLAQLRLRDDPETAARLFADIRKRTGALEAELGIDNAAALSAGDRTAPPLAFFLFNDWHRRIQHSIFEAARRRSVRAAMTTSPWLVRSLAPDVVIVSDTQGVGALRKEIPGVRVVHTRHGLADKNYGYAAAGAVDRVCVTSASVAEEYVRNGLFERERFWVTGYPQLDPLFRALKRGLRPELKTVLFAPTFTEGLSSGPILGPEAVRLIRGNDVSVRVIVRPHPRMRTSAPELLNAWRAASLGLNVEFNDDPAVDIGVLMARSAVMVSDISSIALLYLALDRPLVCVDVADTASRSGHYAPEAVEWRLRAAADVATRDTLASAVAAALADPSRRTAERRDLRRHLFGTLTDGRAGERILDHIRDLRRAR